MQVLLLILVSAVVFPEMGGSPVGEVASIAIVLGAIAGLLFVGAVRAASLQRGLDGPAGPSRLDAAHRSLRRLQTASVAVLVVGIVGLGFLTSIRAFVGNPPLLDEALAIAPAIVAIVVSWWIFHPFERRSRESLLLRRLDEGLPIQATPSRTACVMMQLRSQVLVLLVPSALLLLGVEILRGDPEVPGSPPDWGGMAGGVAVVVGVAFVAPALVVRLVGARPLPPGEVREALERMCRTSSVRVRNLLVWPTGGLVVNAAVTGLVASMRWVMLTDGLLETLRREEVLAVMAHELGHVRRRHMPWMAMSVVALALGSAMAIDPVITVFRDWRWALGGDPQAAIRDLRWIDLGGTVAVLMLVLLGFGWVSRRFERQADAFAAASLDDGGSPVDAGHDGVVSSTGIAAMSAALTRVAENNGVAAGRFSWRHGSIDSRLRQLERLVDVPRRRMPIDRLVRRIKLASVGLVVVAGGWWWGLHLPETEESPAAGVASEVRSWTS